MRPFLFLLLGGIAQIASAHSIVAQPLLEQRTRSFTIVLKGPVAEVTPLFGPDREKEWAPSWSPELLSPAETGQAEGLVFKTQDQDDKEKLWVLTTYLPKEGRVEYVCVTPGHSVNQIKIRVISTGVRQSKATVTYRRSAIAPAGNDDVRRLTTSWAEHQRKHWQGAINAVLEKRSAHD